MFPRIQNTTQNTHNICQSVSALADVKKGKRNIGAFNKSVCMSNITTQTHFNWKCMLTPKGTQIKINMNTLAMLAMLNTFLYGPI